MSGMMHIGEALALVALSLVKMPKRRKTSEQVTAIERTIKMMMIHVRPIG